MVKFIMMCGLSGSGKSKVAHEIATENAVILSSDDIREKMYGDVNNQEHNDEVFKFMFERTVDALNDGHDVIYDATNLNSKRRTALLNMLNHKVNDLKSELHLVLAPPEQCIANQQKRDRKVPDYVIRKQLCGFMTPSMNEGWTESIMVHNPYYRDTYFDELIAANKGISQLGPWHQETVDKHMDMVAQYAKSHNFSSYVQNVASFHDIGKFITRSVSEDGHTHFYNHENAGAYLYLCAKCKTGPLLFGDWYNASLIQYHMSLTKGAHPEKLMAKVGKEMYEDIRDLREADENGAVRESELLTMNILKFMNAFDDWEDRISQPPYSVTVKHDGDYVLLKYQQLNSDMSIKLVQECRGSIFKKNEDGQWQYVCRPFDKFFNYGESNADEVDWSTARVLAKVDGALIKIFYDNGWHLATNGTIDAFKAPVSDLGYSFGDVFNRALGYDFRILGGLLNPEYTYMFELTAPDTQVVIPYEDGVWYLSRRHTESGKEEFDRPILTGVKHPKQYFVSNFEDVIEAASKMSKDEEGFVVNDAQSHRVKVKSPEYLIAAHLANNNMVSNRNIVIYMQEGKLDDFLAYCPQHAGRVQAILDKFNVQSEFLELEWNKVKDYVNLSQKEFAAIATKSEAKAYLFTKKQNPEISAEQFLLSRTTPTLMRTLGLKDSKEEFALDELNEDER